MRFCYNAVTLFKLLTNFKYNLSKIVRYLLFVISEVPNLQYSLLQKQISVGSQFGVFLKYILTLLLWHSFAFFFGYKYTVKSILTFFGKGASFIRKIHASKSEMPLLYHSFFKVSYRLHLSLNLVSLSETILTWKIYLM